MDHIASFFAKISKPFNSKDELLKNVSIAISEIVGVEIDRKNIKVMGGIVYVRENPILKNEIFFKKKQILEKMKELIGEKAPKDIK